MLRSYARRWRNQLRGLAEIRHAPPREWLVSSFGDLVPVRGNRDAMLSAISLGVRHVASAFDTFIANGESGATFAAALIYSASALDDGTIRDKAVPLRAYVEASVTLRFMRATVEYLAELSTESIAMDALELIDLVLDHQPASRVAHLVRAEILLDRDQVEEGLESIRTALRIDAVCVTAQQLLFRAYRMKRAAGSDAGELAALDYDLSDKFCKIPFTHFSTGFRGEAFPCLCPSWLPFSIGNVLEADSFEAIWNSAAAVEIRRSILDGDYSYCSRTQCPMIGARRLPPKASVTDPILRSYIDNRTTRIDDAPEFVELNHDPTCNLACPSCRTDIIVSKAEEQDVYAHAAERVILPLLRRVHGYAYISGGGESFASKHFRTILKTLNRAEYPGVSIILITNATMLTPQRWSEYPDLPEMIDVVLVSLDAAEKSTYERLRPPARWDVVMKNLEHIGQMRREGKLKALGLNFVVQNDNFREMLDFIDLGDRYAADYFWFQRLTSYGTYDEARFNEVDVTSPLHPNHGELLEILRHSKLKRDGMQLNMFLPLLPEVVAAGEPLSYLAVSHRRGDDQFFQVF